MKTKGKTCKYCRSARRVTYLQYEQLPGGMRVVRENERGEMVYNTYCPTCKIHASERKE